MQQGSHRSHRDGVDDRISIVVQRIDRRAPARTAGRVQALTQANACRIRGEQRRHTLARSPTHMLVRSECSARTCDFECNHSDEITLQPALDHLTQSTPTHTYTQHTFVTFIYKSQTSLGSPPLRPDSCMPCLAGFFNNKQTHTHSTTHTHLTAARSNLHTRRSIKRKLTTPKKSFRLEIRVVLGTYIHHNNDTITTTRQKYRLALSLESNLIRSSPLPGISKSIHTTWHYHNDTKEPPAAAQSQQRPPSATMRMQSPPARPRRPSPNSSHSW